MVQSNSNGVPVLFKSSRQLKSLRSIVGGVYDRNVGQLAPSIQQLDDIEWNELSFGSASVSC